MVEKYSMEFRVSSYDVDPARRLKLSSLLKVIQEAAGRHLDGDVLTYEYMREKGIVFLLVKEAVKVYHMPKYNEPVTVETWFLKTKGAQFIRNLRFLGADGILAEAETYWVIVDPVSHRILRPSAYPFEMRSHEQKVGIHASKFDMPQNIEKVGVRPVRWSDTDCNRHMNNAVYPDVICDFFPGGMNEREISTLQIHFLGEAVEGEEITVSAGTGKNGEYYFRGETPGRACFEAFVISKKMK
ncbi:MAG TPA: acyl-ACP thioesterase domain-containing protein [Clostridia bacterium]|nr:acyl-ACP thioesterase domain-containing protein [Clostridia bacterium]